MKYLFGDTDIAAQRLEVLADVFEPSTRAFLQGAANGKIRTALDLGCGPGRTTRLLAEVLRPDQTTGLDNSERFLALARRRATATVSFVQHDVRATPFPHTPADAIFCRFLLTHQKDPEALIRKWGAQLRPGGCLLIEEVETIHSTGGVFARYIGIVEAMLAQQSNRLYVGPDLDRIERAGDITKRSSSVHRPKVTDRDAAAMFYLNLQTWKHEPFIRANYQLSLIADLEQELLALSQGSCKESNIEWGLRRMVFQ